MTDHLGFYKSWMTSFPVGGIVYKVQEPYTVLSAGTDFLILQHKKNGTKVRLFRNTPESLEFSASPQV